MNYCSHCGSPVQSRVPEGDNRERHVCPACETIHYSNPNNVCGCILEWQGKVLLCKRAIEPRHGYWTLPAGFMENRETTAEGAAREAREEACAEANGLALFGIYNLPFISQVYLMYHGELRDGHAQAGAETSHVGLFGEHEVPWEELAFPVVIESLQRYFDDRRRGQIRVHHADILSRPGHPLKIERLGE